MKAKGVYVFVAKEAHMTLFIITPRYDLILSSRHKTSDYFQH